MIEFKDNFGIDRAIDFNLSFCGKFINITLYAPSKGNYGNTFQFPLMAFDKLINQVKQLQQDIYDKKI